MRPHLSRHKLMDGRMAWRCRGGGHDAWGPNPEAAFRRWTLMLELGAAVDSVQALSNQKGRKPGVTIHQSGNASAAWHSAQGRRTQDEGLRISTRLARLRKAYRAAFVKAWARLGSR